MTPDQEHRHMMDCLRQWESSHAPTMENPTKLNEDIDELTNRYKPVVRDMLIVLTCPDTPSRIAEMLADEAQFLTRDLLNRVNTKQLESIEKFLPILLAFETLDMLVPVTNA